MDHFHTIQLANRALDQVRRRINNTTLGHRGRRADPLYRIRRIALVGAERLDQDGWDRLIAGIDNGDPTRVSTPPGRPRNSSASCTTPAAAQRPGGPGSAPNRQGDIDVESP